MLPLIDSYHRVHKSLRISVTDRCNIRCFYCMPDERIQFKPREELLRFEEIERFTRVAADLGVHRIRLTGGEPLMRADLPKLIERLAKIPGIDDLALTTNGILLSKMASSLHQAGLQRINISLDTLREETFQKIARRKGLHQVLEGIDAAQQVGFSQIRLNAIAIRGLTEEEIVPLGEFARDHQLELRFIEFMPLDAQGAWQEEQVLHGATIRQILEEAFGPLEPLPRLPFPVPAERPTTKQMHDEVSGDGSNASGSAFIDRPKAASEQSDSLSSSVSQSATHSQPATFRLSENGARELDTAQAAPASQPAVDYQFVDGGGRIGFINPVSQPFCYACDRLRLTAEGQLRNCLFSTAEWDARAILREGGSSSELEQLIRDCLQAKQPGHGIDSPDFLRPERAMYQIGG